jgi:2,4-dienoyl-CoA reductase-like NADH-dependent reductase (Old Yellow Enzyme family)
MIKISSADFTENGTTIDESKQIALRLAEEGMDAIEVSGGTMEGTKSPAWTKINSDADEGYYLSNPEIMKGIVGDKSKIIVVGGFRSPGVIEQAIESGKADFVAICRPFIREPDLVKKWKAGDMKRTDCISCNLCFAESGKEGGTSCGFLKKQQK